VKWTVYQTCDCMSRCSCPSYVTSPSSPNNAWQGALPWLLHWVASLFIKGHLFSPRPVCVGIMTDEIAVGQVFLWVLLFSPVSIIPPIPHTPSFIYHQRYITLRVNSVVKQQIHNKTLGRSVTQLLNTNTVKINQSTFCLCIWILFLESPSYYLPAEFCLSVLWLD
jgi:hypothetical protein